MNFVKFCYLKLVRFKAFAFYITKRIDFIVNTIATKNDPQKTRDSKTNQT